MRANLADVLGGMSCAGGSAGTDARPLGRSAAASSPSDTIAGGRCLPIRSATGIDRAWRRGLAPGGGSVTTRCFRLAVERRTRLPPVDLWLKEIFTVDCP